MSSLLGFLISCIGVQETPVSARERSIDKIKDIFDWYEHFVPVTNKRIELRRFPFYIEWIPWTEYYTESEYQEIMSNYQSQDNIGIYQNNNSYSRDDYYSNPSNPDSFWNENEEETEVIYIYVNAIPPGVRDIQKIAGVQEMVLAKARQEILGIKNDISELVFSSNYDYFRSSNNIPGKLVLTIKQVYTEVKNSLSDPHKSKVSDFTLSLDKKDYDEDLWVRVRKSEKKVFISPKLVRAAFILAYNDKFNYYSSIYNKMKSDPKLWSWTEKDLEIPYQVLIEDISNLFKFVFYHELAHVFLSKNGVMEKSELKCDCYAAHYLSKESSTIDLGLFESLINRSIEEGVNHLWGLDSEKFNKRYRALTELNENPEKLSEEYCNDSLSYSF